MSIAKALKFTLQWEGGFSDNPHDSGGATMKGITQRVFDSYLAMHHRPHAPVRAISDSEVSDIYESQYWKLCKCDMLPEELAIVVFDTAVNTGCSRAIKILQATLDINADGIIGGGTLGAVADFCKSDAEIAFLADSYLTKRENFYRNLVTLKPGNQGFLKGWLNRTQALRRYILA